MSVTASLRVFAERVYEKRRSDRVQPKRSTTTKHQLLKRLFKFQTMTNVFTTPSRPMSLRRHIWSRKCVAFQPNYSSPISRGDNQRQTSPPRTDNLYCLRVSCVGISPRSSWRLASIIGEARLLYMAPFTDLPGTRFPFLLRFIRNQMSLTFCQPLQASRLGDRRTTR